LEAMKEGGPYNMEIKGRNTIELENILIGDVWICSGQSNMEWHLDQSRDAAEEVEAADYPSIRLLTIPRAIAFQPAVDVPETEWKVCSPGTAGSFSAVGYFFGRKIMEETGVPIGLVSSNWGGTDIETWLSASMAATDPELVGPVKELAGYDAESIRKKMAEDMERLVSSFDTESSGKEEGELRWSAPGQDPVLWQHSMVLPALWEDMGLKNVDGVVWFSKELMLTKKEAEGSAVLSLGKIDDSDIAWVNGHKVGETWNLYYADRSYTLPEGVLVEGKNTIIVRVEDTGGGGGIYGAPANLKLTTSEGVRDLAGPWNFRASKKEVYYNTNIMGPNDRPTLLFNGMIHPLLNMQVTGVIWYQGENNASRAYRYRKLFQMLIKDWRTQWSKPDLGFYFVQLANYMKSYDQPTESAWAELREAQTMALELDYTGMAVAIDIGEANDIHPKNKQDVGLRLALAALHTTYGKDLVYSGPLYQSARKEGKGILIQFTNTGSGLCAHDRYGYVKGFAIAGEDQVWHWAKATISGNELLVWSEEVPDPVAVRYAWADNPDDANLYNKEGLPASPFRTDGFRGVTE